MYSGVSTYCACSAVVIPAHAGSQAAPRIWIPAYAGMTFHLYVHAPDKAFNMDNTLSQKLDDGEDEVLGFIE